jgi:hypothetical protein
MAIKHILGLLACSLLLASCEFLTQEPTEGKINYVVVGITYTGTNDNLDTLTYTDDDAVSLAKAFALWGSHSGRTPSGKILTSEPSKVDFVLQLQALQSSASSHDLTIITYSGHGFEDGSLAFPDTSGYQTMTPKKLLDLVSPIPGRKLLVLDSCYSGAFADTYGLTSNTNVWGSNPWSVFFNDASYGLSDLFILASSTSETTSIETDSLQHGVFTYYLLKGLGWTSDSDATLSTPGALDDNGNVTVDSLYDYILPKALAYEDSANDTHQRVTVNGTADDLVLFSY